MPHAPGADVAAQAAEVVAAVKAGADISSMMAVDDDEQVQEAVATAAAMAPATVDV